MLGIVCQICNKRPATTHLTELDPADGARREVHLCSACIEQLDLKLEAGPPPVAEILKKKTQTAKDQAIDITVTPSDAQDDVCEGCGLTFSDFAANNRFGCQQCYSDFSDKVETLLSRYHGSSVHAGRRPAAAPGIDERVARRAQLDAALREAVAQEAYERAAALRDELRRLSE